MIVEKVDGLHDKNVIKSTRVKDIKEVSGNNG